MSGEHGTVSGTGFRSVSDTSGSRWVARSEEAKVDVWFLTVYILVGIAVALSGLSIALWKTYPPGAPAVTPESSSSFEPTGVQETIHLTAFMTGYIGSGAPYDGMRNPTLNVHGGDSITIVVTNGETQTHDLRVDGYNVQTKPLSGLGSSGSVTFVATQGGSFAYYCTQPGHRAAGMSGTVVVGTPTGPTIGPELPLTVPTITKNPTDLPPPITRNTSATVHIFLHAVEVTAEIEPGTSYQYWTYNGTVPGPFFRVRVGDTVVVHFSNDANSTMNHSVDFHAVTGPGGGAAVTQTAPGLEKVFSFMAMYAGLFVYHCASPDVPTHLAEGMYGLILVQSETPLPAVDHEYYMMQGELYTHWGIHTPGNQLFDGAKMLNETPTYVVFNGAYNALTKTHALRAEVNETVRIYFGVGGPNLISSFHAIGTMFDTLYATGSLMDPPLHGVQTTLVAPGDAVIATMTMLVPGNYTIVDHALTRTFEQGALAVLSVTGPGNSSIFRVGSAVEMPAIGGSSGGSGAIAREPE